MGNNCQSKAKRESDNSQTSRKFQNFINQIGRMPLKALDHRLLNWLDFSGRPRKKKNDKRPRAAYNNNHHHHQNTLSLRGRLRFYFSLFSAGWPSVRRPLQPQPPPLFYCRQTPVDLSNEDAKVDSFYILQPILYYSRTIMKIVKKWQWISRTFKSDICWKAEQKQNSRFLHLFFIFSTKIL